jgi:hypothetical protein
VVKAIEHWSDRYGVAESQTDPPAAQLKHACALHHNTVASDSVNDDPRPRARMSSPTNLGQYPNLGQYLWDYGRDHVIAFTAVKRLNPISVSLCYS